jgi:hypothetical protein
LEFDLGVMETARDPLKSQPIVPTLVLLLMATSGGAAADDVAKSPSAEVCLALVGDLMHHCTQSTGARFAAGGEGHDFRKTFEHAATLFDDADLVIGNLETPVDGRLEDHCFPRFSAPVEYLDALQDAGFDVLSVANNHAIDRGTSGLTRTLERIRSRGMHPVGATPGARRVVVEQGGLELAFLAATRYMNFPCRGAPCPMLLPATGHPEVLLEAIREEAAAGRAVVVLLHWMGEYQERPRKRQRDLAAVLVEAGATLIVGAHSHVLSTTAFLSPSPHRLAYVRYSLGNFVHAMKRFPAKLGGVDRVCLRAGPEGPTVTRADFIPTYVRRNAGPEADRVFQPVPLEDALAQCRSGEGDLSPLSQGECREMKALKRHLDANASFVPALDESQ